MLTSSLHHNTHLRSYCSSLHLYFFYKTTNRKQICSITICVRVFIKISYNQLKNIIYLKFAQNIAPVFDRVRKMSVWVNLLLIELNPALCFVV